MKYRINNKKYMFFSVLILCLSIAVILYIKTISDMKPVPESFNNVLLQSHKPRILDRYGVSINTNYEDKWNNRDLVEIHEIQGFLINSFLISEDKRFFEHKGIDWRARLAAIYVNIKNQTSLRGASTITEQVVRMINNRPRKIWSKWVEGWEARSLEKNFSKYEILEFYLNQVPYASNRRGIVQAARYYFDRDLETLTPKEMLALVVLVRAPSRMDLYNGTGDVDSSIQRLSERLIKRSLLSKVQSDSINSQKLQISGSFPTVSAPHFTEHIKILMDKEKTISDKIITTLDSSLQKTIQSLLDNHLKNIHSKRVFNGAVLVADHKTSEILAWVVGSQYNDDIPGSYIDAVTVPRQPGSALKPFLYTLAIEKGWTASTIIKDTPLTELVGNGLHSYQNYSRTFYGPVTLRQALANSLNIPAVKTLQFVGDLEYINRLRNLGFDGLTNHPDFYGDGISLGNGEVSLYQLVQAYSTLGNKGVSNPLTPFYDSNTEIRKRVFSEEASSIIANILSDPEARSLEFGDNSVLNFPVQTAVKTGTSSDYRDAWAVGFNYKYTVGVWMGNLDQTPTDGLTGSTGPALLLRSIFNELTKNKNTKPLFLSPKLIRYDTCINYYINEVYDNRCRIQSEWYVKGTVPYDKYISYQDQEKVSLSKPVNGLHLALNPRIPSTSQSFEFSIRGVKDSDKVLWNIDGDTIKSYGSSYEWNLVKGRHIVSASVWRNNNKIAEIRQTSFLVK